MDLLKTNQFTSCSRWKCLFIIVTLYCYNEWKVLKLRHRKNKLSQITNPNIMLNKKSKSREWVIGIIQKEIRQTTNMRPENTFTFYTEVESLKREKRVHDQAVFFTKINLTKFQ